MLIRENQITGLLKLYDELDNSMQRVECALPSQMTEAVFQMVTARQLFRARLQSVMRHATATKTL